MRELTMFRFVTTLVLITIIAAMFWACRDDGFDTDPSIRLDFSTDSLLFDTVFVNVGSATLYFQVYNHHNRRINISSVSLASGADSYFRINVDGSSGTTVNDVEINARDSIFIFVEVTVDPVNQSLPLIIADSILFNTNNNLQDVKLVAWGQDANFIHPNYEDPESGIKFHVITENTTWTNTLPYVIYGLAVVAPDITLSIEEGASIHFHNNASMIFLERSTLKANGSREHPIFFQGDRLEKFYRELPGQWGRIWLYPTSKDHEINHAVIKNGTIGLHVDTIGSLERPTLTIRNSIIKNMSIAGLFAQGSHVVAENLIIANCREHAALLTLGGTYEFRHCTFANYYSLQSRQTPSLVLNNYYEDINGNIQIRDFNYVYFANSIIFGSLQEELRFDLYPGTSPAYTFDHCLLKTQMLATPPGFYNPIQNQNPLFRDVRENDYRLLENSPAIGAGKPEVSSMVPFDILGNDRSQRSDIGAIQYHVVEEE